MAQQPLDLTAPSSGFQTERSADGLPNGSPDGRKRGDLCGGALTEEALASSRRVLSAHRGNGNAFLGLQQWFSPPEAACLIARVFGDPGAVLDPTAGSGALLAPYPKERRFGIEIDRDHTRAAAYAAISGDAQAVVPMLRAAGTRFPAIVLNPPFGLSWRDRAHAKGEINSTLLAYLWALDLLSHFGQGALICGTDRLARELFARPEGAGFYAVVDVEGSLFDGVSLPTSIAFFVRPDNRREGELVRIPATRENLPEAASEVIGVRHALSGYVSPRTTDPTEPARDFGTVAREHERRAREADGSTGHRTRRFDVAMKAGKVAVHLSAYSKLALAKAGGLREVELLSGQHPACFGQNPRVWRQLREAADENLIELDPTLRDRAEREIEQARKHTTPLFPVKPQMRLGWLADLDRIRCERSDPARGYEAGEEYPLRTRSKVASETERRVVDNRHGEPELRQFVTERRLLEVRVGDHAFDEGVEGIRYLTEHFELPDPGCVATRHPEEVRRNRRLLEEMEEEIRSNHDAYMKARGEKDFEPFSFKPFQADHMSRLLVKRRGMLAMEQGLGKTLMLMTLAEATVSLGAKPQALFVVPQDLIPQWQREARKFFGRTLEEIRTPAQARRAARRVRSGEPGWWITYYEALSVVGRKNELLPEAYLDHRVALARRLAEYKRKKRFAPSGSGPSDGTRTEGDAKREKPVEAPVEGATTRDACPACRATTNEGWDGESCPQCCYAHRSVYVKSAYSHLTSAFEGGVKCVDEVSEIRGDDSLRSKAIRALARGAHNYGATGTPLSNYINDAYWGLWFSLGNATPAFPYSYSGGKAKFEADFCVVEYLMGRREDGEEHLRKRRKVLPRITNVSQFWRLAQPGVSRCRKEQTGEPLVKRTYHPVRVPMGVSQQKAHAFWLSRFADYFAWKRPDHPMVEQGLVEKWAAALGQLWRLETAATLPASDEPSREWPEARAKLGELSDFTPAALKVLEIAKEHAEAGEKVLVGSDLILTGRWLSERLREKGVRAVHITEERSGKVGTKNPRKRAKEVEAFVSGDAQVLCAGVGAMKLGHNLDVASAVIVHGLPYSFMALDQFIARVHRLTSRRDVSVYVVVPRGSLAERKWELLKDKGGASDLAFDGELSVQPEEAIDWARVLRDMKAQGIRTAGDEVLEADVADAWRRVPSLVSASFAPTLRPRNLAPLDELPEYVQTALF